MKSTSCNSPFFLDIYVLFHDHLITVVFFAHPPFSVSSTIINQFCCFCLPPESSKMLTCTLSWNSSCVTFVATLGAGFNLHWRVCGFLLIDHLHCGQPLQSCCPKPSQNKYSELMRIVSFGWTGGVETCDRKGQSHARPLGSVPSGGHRDRTL